MLAWLLLVLSAHADSLVTSIVTDPLSGVAIDGYDPVSYFLGAQPQPGLPDYEYIWQGVPWYFASAANRDVFKGSPEIYAPQFGGHCVVSLSRGYLSDGKARLYAIEALKLYFFYSAANRDAFLLAKTATLADAAAHWPELSKQLSGPGAADALTIDPSAADASSVESSAETPAADALAIEDSASSVAPSAADANVSSN